MPLLSLLERAAVSEQLQREIRALTARRFGPAPSGTALVCHRTMPAVKVERVLTQLLAEVGHEPIERVEIDARSGCSDFSGTLEVTVAGTRRTFDFVWDCRWRAEQEGWRDHWGEPDQIRAAREFGWQCFANWSERIQ
ncbi:MAG TPA: hypothetical protein VHM67_02250 [Gemmatimonadaceae bacterium]|nr:hypothetical protein [Gemmatimonadaceae bacterium]